ncbi:MAG: hypothetical protein AYK19_21465 [Theionarchaea archaeon DG-70-1]|nr:MAG: hypothetical protein AYK19_21465 [Theionarchaea archaeon DG-70-1]
MGPLCNIKISADGEYIAVGTSNSQLFLSDKNGNELWSKKVTDTFFVSIVVISAHGEYIAVDTEKGFFSLFSSFDVYSREGNLLWRYEIKNPLKAIAISGDGHYLAASDGHILLIFDNFQAIEEYASSECAQENKVLTVYYL